MSTTIVAVVINILSMVLPYIGITIGTDQLTNTVQTIVALVTGVWIWIQRTQMRRVEVGESSDVTKLGMKKG